jgi:SAM-dependent methyltransferase
MDMSGWQLSGDAPAAYARYAYILMEPWTDDLISQALCEKGERVLDIACGTGLVASRVNLVSNAECKVTGIDINEGMLNVAKKNANIEWHLGSATELPFKMAALMWCYVSKGCNTFLIARRRRGRWRGFSSLAEESL